MSDEEKDFTVTVGPDGKLSPSFFDLFSVWNPPILDKDFRKEMDLLMRKRFIEIRQGERRNNSAYRWILPFLPPVRFPLANRQNVSLVIPDQVEEGTEPLLWLPALRDVPWQSFTPYRNFWINFANENSQDVENIAGFLVASIDDFLSNYGRKILRDYETLVAMESTIINTCYHTFWEEAWARVDPDTQTTYMRRNNKIIPPQQLEATVSAGKLHYTVGHIIRDIVPSLEGMKNSFSEWEGFVPDPSYIHLKLGSCINELTAFINRFNMMFNNWMRVYALWNKIVAEERQSIQQHGFDYLLVRNGVPEDRVESGARRDREL